MLDFARFRFPIGMKTSYYNVIITIIISLC